MNQCDTSVINETRTRHEFSGDYCTKRVILEIYDAMQESSRTGHPYQTHLEPPGPPSGSLPYWLAGQPRPTNWPNHIHPPRGCA